MNALEIEIRVRGGPIYPPGLYRWPAVTVGNDTLWVAYGRANFVTNTTDVVLRGLALEGPGASCTTSWMCRSGHCELGACVGPPDGGTVTSDAGLEPEPVASWLLGE